MDDFSAQEDQQTIMQKYNTAVRNMRWRAVAFAYIY